MTKVKKGIILAAGRGSRLGSITDSNPKGLTNVSGTPLIEWQHLVLKSAGVEDIYVITGYLNKVISSRGYKTIFNPDWNKGNMVSSINLALDYIKEPFILSYSDIIYSPKIVQDLIQCSAKLSVAFDKNWLKLWEMRFEDPLSDAESFILGTESNILEIGRKTNSLDDIQGQFMGLLKIDLDANKFIKRLISKKPYIRLEYDTTSLLNIMIKDGFPIHAIPNSCGWCEIDSPSDLAIANSLVENGIIKKPY